MRHICQVYIQKECAGRKKVQLGFYITYHQCPHSEPLLFGAKKQLENIDTETCMTISHQ